MKKFNFGKIFGLVVAAIAVFAFAFAGCEDANDPVKRYVPEPEPTKVETSDDLKTAFEDENVTEINIEDDIDGSEEILTVKGNKKIYIPGGKETSIGTLQLEAGSHVEIMNAGDTAGSGQSVRAALAVVTEAAYNGWTTLVIWNHFNIPEGAAFDLIGRVRLIFRKDATVENGRTFNAEEDGSVLLEEGSDNGVELAVGLGLGADVPTIAYGPKPPVETPGAPVTLGPTDDIEFVMTDDHSEGLELGTPETPVNWT
jgi:hypothetical protein